MNHCGSMKRRGRMSMVVHPLTYLHAQRFPSTQRGVITIGPRPSSPLPLICQPSPWCSPSFWQWQQWQGSQTEQHDDDDDDDDDADDADDDDDSRSIGMVDDKTLDHGTTARTMAEYQRHRWQANDGHHWHGSQTDDDEHSWYGWRFGDGEQPWRTGRTKMEVGKQGSGADASFQRSLERRIHSGCVRKTQ